MEHILEKSLLSLQGGSVCLGNSFRIEKLYPFSSFIDLCRDTLKLPNSYSHLFGTPWKYGNFDIFQKPTSFSSVPRFVDSVVTCRKVAVFRKFCRKF